LTEFARACKAAARAVALYPATHPAIATTLARVADLTSATQAPNALRITVLPESLLLDGRAPERIDQATLELAALLHNHRVGELTIHPDGDVEAWLGFLLLLARPPDAVRAEGGIARLWMTQSRHHVELRELDYAEVLRERVGGDGVAWDRIVASCLEGGTILIDEETLRALVAIAGDEQRLMELVAALDEQAGGSLPARIAALGRLLRSIADAAESVSRDSYEQALRHMATAVGQVSPEMMLELLVRRQASDLQEGPAAQLFDEVVSRMSDDTIAGFIGRSVARDGGATERLAQAFQVLVTDPDRRHHVVGLAREASREGPETAPDFDAVWDKVRDLLTSYSDQSFVSGSYGRELTSARTQAIDVERISDDPPERLAAWLGTVGPGEVQTLDLLLLTDLLRIEDDQQNWQELMAPVAAQIEDLLLVGDFEAAEQLAAAVARESGPLGAPGRQEAAAETLSRLASGGMMRHLASHLAALDDARFERVKAFCLTIGESVVRPLAEALSVEQRARTREQLTALLIAFGATGRQTVERLRSSQNPAVRRTAIYLLREFGGSEALPDLTMLLDDAEPRVQREAVRAILNIGTGAAYAVLRRALTSGSSESREAIMQAIGLVRDERATPLLADILAHVDYRGPLRPIYLRAIESLGALRDPDGIEPLKQTLYRGEWWAPRRSTQLRTAAAHALARIGTPDALEVLKQAAAAPSRGVRLAARAALDRAARGEVPA
jgi:hypothetical protein